MSTKKISATSWRLENWNSAKPPFTYVIQLEFKDGRTFRKLEKIFAGERWILFGEGHNSKKDTSIYIFHGHFNSSAEWVEWTRANFPYPLEQLDRNNKPKSVRLGSTPARKRGRPRKTK